MLAELIKNRNKYFWSKTESGTILIGGYENGRFYGQIELLLNEKTAIIKTEVSNGVSHTMKLADRSYSNLTDEYQIIKDLYDNFDNYLADPDTKYNQEVNREKLLQNVMSLLPKYDDIA